MRFFALVQLRFPLFSLVREKIHPKSVVILERE